MKHLVFPLAITAISGLAGCGLFDSETEWEEGSYKLVWIDTQDNISLYRALPDDALIARVDAPVYAVGYDGHYLVAKQHPGGDKSKTSFFVVDAMADSKDADPKKVVDGPLTESEYQTKAVQLGLPQFSKTLRTLE